MRQLPDLPVFSAAELAALGWTREALRHAVRTGTLVRLRRGVFTSVRSPGSREHALAAAVAMPRATVSHRSAAVVDDLPLLDAAPIRPQLTVAPGGPVNAAGCHVHRARLSPQDVVRIEGARCSVGARTFVDIARSAPLAEAVAIGDAVLHRGTPREEIERVLRGCWNWPRIRAAQHAAALLDGAAESPLESISRLALRDTDLAPPDLQRVILNDWGGFVARVDFYWDRYGVVGQADGLAKYGDIDARAAMLKEKRQQERLEELGLIVVRWGWREARYAQHELERRLRDACARGDLWSRSGFPRKWLLGPCASPAQR